LIQLKVKDFILFGLAWPDTMKRNSWGILSIVQSWQSFEQLSSRQYQATKPRLKLLEGMAASNLEI